MDVLSDIGGGFAVALTPTSLLFVVIGVLIGTVVGVLPGLGPTATIGLLLPFTYALEPTSAIIMLAGIYYGAMYGGAITSVLLRIPGEAASVITAIDGYQLARKGRAVDALAISAISSFVGGMLAVLALLVLAPAAASVALSFGPIEFAALTVLGLVLVTTLSGGPVWKGVVCAAIGLVLGSVGLDPFTGTERFTFGSLRLVDGLDFVVVAIGLFGVGEILYRLDAGRTSTAGVPSSIRRFWPSREATRDSVGATGRGALAGSFLGLLPGGGGVMGSVASYAWEKRRSKTPERFGTGEIAGVAGPEAANNASSTTSFVPLLTLGIPPNAVLALLYGALLIQGITPGPSLISDEPDVFWGVIVSMLVGNVVLVALNLPLVGVFAQLARVRMSILGPAAILVSLIGTYSINNSTFDVAMVVAFGVLGYLMRRYGFDTAPLLLAFIIGPMAELAVRQSLVISGGDPTVFVTSPVSAAVLAVMVGGLCLALRRARSTTPTGPVTTGVPTSTSGESET